MAPMVSMPYGNVTGIEKSISRLILGTVAFEHELDKRQAFALLDAFAELGGNTVDTGRHYGDPTERALGEWMRATGHSEQFVIVGKGGHPRDGRPRITRDDVDADLHRSLELLQREQIDLYFLHRDDETVPVGEIVEWLNAHARAGRIAAFGGSNWRPERIDAANAYAVARGLTPFAATSPQFSLAAPLCLPWAGCISASGPNRGWYERRAVPLFAWSSQAQGFFSGRYAPDLRSDPSMVDCWYSAMNFERQRRVSELAARVGTSAIAISLAWVLHQTFPTFALIGPRSIDELYASAEALAVHLTPEEVRWLNLEDESQPL